ncbi:MAG: hypothetical protein KDA41_12820, partial [Planctomycetales bacterium]|nr:hypothetical protein [Planctomycetales bacterium]
VKTVAYYLVPAGGRSGDSFDAAGAGGLVRRSLDRAATQWAVDNGDTSRLEGAAQLLAPEVVAIEFRYWDGAQWQTEWDTQANGGLPLAVEVAIAIAPATDDNADADRVPAARPGVSTLSATANSNWQVYRQVIRIPAAQPTSDAEAIDVDELE